MEEIRFNSQDKEFNSTQDVRERQVTGLVGFLVKISRGIIKEEAANNILVIITVVFFTLSAIIFSRLFFLEKNNAQYPPPIPKEMIVSAIKYEFPEITDAMIKELPETFYREDIPSSIASKLPQEIINSIPPRP